MRVPIIPIYNNGLAPPSPTARRCFALGRMVRRFVEDWLGNERVALLASGSISLEVGGPRDTSWFDRAWLDTVTGLIKEGRYQVKAVRIHSFGGPEVTSSNDVPKPTPWGKVDCDIFSSRNSGEALWQTGEATLLPNHPTQA